MNRVIIEVRGGMVQMIHATDPSLRIMIVDWDNIHEGHESFPENDALMEPDYVADFDKIYGFVIEQKGVGQE